MQKANLAGPAARFFVGMASMSIAMMEPLGGSNATMQSA